jgi:hypothetical protein
VKVKGVKGDGIVAIIESARTALTGRVARTELQRLLCLFLFGLLSMDMTGRPPVLFFPSVRVDVCASDAIHTAKSSAFYI